MPYVVSTKRLHAITAAPGCDDYIATSCRAVATLEEARNAADEAVIAIFDTAVPHVRLPVARYCQADEWSRIEYGFRDAVQALPESGGTVGPLPDGTVIQVERVAWAYLEDEMDRLDGVDRPMAEIIAAFNAR
jgi:hypothetical protein